MLELKDALGASRDLHVVLEDTFSLLLPLLEADCAALATTSLEREGKLDWVEKGLPKAFFGAYEKMAPYDFVLSAVQSNPGTVLRDNRMIDRQALERNELYQWAHELGVPIKQVMAVMLPVGGGFQSGLSLYRDRRRPFTLRHQRVLQELTPAIANAVRHCWASAKAARREKLLGVRARPSVLVRPSGRELERTAAATPLLDKWFPPAERVAGSLPRPLVEGLAQAKAARTRGDARPWERKGAAADLKVKFIALSEPVDEPSWVVELREVPHIPTLPAALVQDLTDCEREVAARVMRGWDNQLIADDLGKSPLTVRDQLKSICIKLGVSDRKKLMSFLWEASLDA
ncbi:helix-turn-helix transcriptional regulator [Sorangium sp. So ce291]|uniref:helix-turn-helix transcriptional regulator n=1 Tax=Sorangium sp. So ce291 TaxID=3133294 RepID=UPI003F5F59EA